jgi:hypothetical protein
MATAKETAESSDVPFMSGPDQYQSIQEKRRESARSITGSHSPVLLLPSLLNWQPWPHSVSMPAPPSTCRIAHYTRYTPHAADKVAVPLRTQRAVCQ